MAKQLKVTEQVARALKEFGESRKLDIRSSSIPGNLVDVSAMNGTWLKNASRGGSLRTNPTFDTRSDICTFYATTDWYVVTNAKRNTNLDRSLWCCTGSILGYNDNIKKTGVPIFLPARDVINNVTENNKPASISGQYGTCVWRGRWEICSTNNQKNTSYVENTTSVKSVGTVTKTSLANMFTNYSYKVLTGVSVENGNLTFQYSEVPHLVLASYTNGDKTYYDEVVTNVTSVKQDITTYKPSI